MPGPGDTDDVIAALLDRALDAANRGDVTTVHRLASEVLAEDATNAEAGELMASDLPGAGELRRATLMFCDLVGSTELSGRHEPERYWNLVRRYKRECTTIIERYDGHLVGAKGDGLLALFGVPRAHGNDVERAIRAGLDIVDAVHELSATTQRQVGESLDVRVAVHRGIVFFDHDDGDVYGLAANVAARLESLAEPGTVVVSKEVRELAAETFAFEAQAARPVKGVVEPLQPFRVEGERPGAGARPVRDGPALVGRDAELERLTTTWSEASAGDRDRPSTVVVRGDAGIGKTRLVRALTEQARREGATVIELAGSPLHADTGFHPVRTLIEQRSGVEGDADGVRRLDRLRGELDDAGLDPDRLVPLLAPVLGVAPTAGYEPAASDARKLHEEISQAAHEYLLARLAPGPAVLVAEDVQWFDDATRSVLDRLAARAPTPLLVLVTARPDTTPPSGSEVVDLAPLSSAASHALLDALGLTGLDDDDRRALVTRGDGVPLYLEELARVAAETRASIGATTSPTLAPGAVPDLLYELLVARLYATPTVAPVAAAAATIGRDVDHALLAEVIDVTEIELAPALETLRAEHVLEADGMHRSRFRHELLREVAYELQPPSKRRSLHGRVGDALVRRHTATDVVDWGVVANHFEHAGRRAAAADAFEHAADEARRRGALDEARSNLGKAIQSVEGLAPGGGRDRREVELRLRRGFLATSMEGNASTSAVADYGRCLSLAGLDATDDSMFRTLIVLWGYFVSRGELDRAHQVLTILRPALTGTREFWMPFNTAGFGMIDWYSGRFDRALNQLELAGVEASTIGRDDEVEASWLNPMDPEVSIHTHLALARFVRGDRSGADDALGEAAARAAGLAFPQGPFSAAYVLAFTAWMHVETEDFDAADDAVERLMDLAGQHGFDSWTLVAVTERTTLHALRDLHAPAPDRDALTTHAGMIEGLVAAWSQFDMKAMLPFYLTVLGTVVAATGDRITARTHFEASLALAKSTGMHFYDTEALRRAAAASENPADTTPALCDALRTARAQGAHLFELRTALDLHARDAAYATELDAATRHFAPDARYPELERARAAVVAGA